MEFIRLLYGILCLVQLTTALKSYLDWPRIHFGGKYVAEPSTINNLRCNYYNEHFTSTNLSPELKAVRKNNWTGTYYDAWWNWNPEGSGQFFFADAVVTSVCESPKVNCSTEDPIVGLSVSELSPAALVDLDTDWQTASTLYGFVINIANVLQGNFNLSEIQHPVKPNDMFSGMMKSVLSDVTWMNDHYKKMFNNATTLSITLSMDRFSEYMHFGRLTATIGPTSPQDPLSVPAYRAMQPELNLRPAPFKYDEEEKLLVIDLSLSLMPDPNGTFEASKMGILDLAILSEPSLCSNPSTSAASNVFKSFSMYGLLASFSYNVERVLPSSSCTLSTEDEGLIRLTEGGTLTKLIGDDNKWFDLYGGILTVNLSNVAQDKLDQIPNNRLAIVQYSVLPSQKNEITLREFPYGIRMGMMGRIIERANVGDEYTWTAFVTSFGKPLENGLLTMRVFENSIADTVCGFTDCYGPLGTPEVLQITPIYTGDEEEREELEDGFIRTNSDGLASFKLTATADPGNPRGCGLDGQVYPIELFLKYESPFGVVTYVEGDATSVVPPGTYYDYSLAVTSPAVVIYSEYKQVEDPTWADVDSIFQLYFNLFPVMWKNGIVNLGIYEGVVNSSSAINASMHLPMTNPRYMPVTRDLSRSKFKVIQDWFNGGMKPSPAVNNELRCSDYPSAEAGKKELFSLLQRAISLELSTIPPYYTTWLSLQTELGKNIEIGEIIHSVFVEEMFHMSLASNALNAIGGKVELTTFTNIPIYPTTLGFGRDYELAPKIMATLEPMSLGLLNDIFSQIEEPASEKQRKIFEVLACLLKILLTQGVAGPSFVERPVSARFLAEYLNDTAEIGICTHDPAGNSWENINRISAQGLRLLANSEISTIGSFYLYVMLQMSFLESCAQTGQVSINGNSIFSGGNIDYQINYPPDVFPVFDLLKAMEAVVEIVYQGEGGSLCTPYVYNGTNELSHYYRFQEIYHGRRLEEVPLDYVVNSAFCIPLHKVCGYLNPGVKYCYVGDIVPFNVDGIWNTIPNPTDAKYVPDSNAAKLNNRFNKVYTDLLKCLYTTFGGDPDILSSCISKMYDITIVGKILMKTQVQEGEYKGKSVTPTWLYFRNETDRAGLAMFIR